MQTEPSDEITERACLSAVLKCPIELAKLLNSATEQMFYSEDNRRIFAAIKNCRDVKVPVNIKTAMQSFSVLFPDENLPAIRQLLEVLDMDGEATHVNIHLPSLVDCYRKREAARSSQRLQRNVLDAEKDTVEAIRNGIASLQGLLVDDYAEPMTFRELTEIMYDGHSAEEVIKGEYIVKKGPSTGYCDLDAHLQGLKSGRLIIIGGRAGEGKTEFLCQLIANVHANGYNCLSLPLEMTESEYSARLLGIALDKAHFLIPTVYRYPAEAEKCLTTLENAREYFSNLVIKGCSGKTAEQIDLIIEQDVLKRGTKLVFVDYLGKIKGNHGDQREVVAHTVRALKDMALKNDVCIICAAQLNRGKEYRADKSPMLSDLRDSGDIEQEADQILMLSQDKERSQFVVDIVKNRHVSGFVTLRFDFDPSKQKMEEVKYDPADLGQ